MKTKQKQANLEENLMGLAYLDFVGLNKAKEKGSKIHQAMEIKGVQTGRLHNPPARIWCPFADESNFDCPNIGVEESCTDGKKPCLKLSKDTPTDRPFDLLDPWDHHYEVSPGHMNF